MLKMCFAAKWQVLYIYINNLLYNAQKLYDSMTASMRVTTLNWCHKKFAMTNTSNRYVLSFSLGSTKNQIDCGKVKTFKHLA